MTETDQQYHQSVVIAGIAGSVMFFIGGLSLGISAGYRPLIDVMGDSIIGAIPPLISLALVLVGVVIIRLTNRTIRNNNRDGE